jgi:gamma-butyrobetaine dioxygenase
VTNSDTGKTRFVDGLAAAHQLRDTDPEAFRTLTDTEVTYRAEYPWAEKMYESRTTIIQVDQHGNVTTLVNNPSKMFFNNVPFDTAPNLYRAYANLKNTLQHTPCSYLHTWHQGDTVLFDNRRIFHGRAEFSPSITRTLRGGYLREVEILARTRYLAAIQP